MNLDEIIEERIRQDAKWGPQNHQDLPPLPNGHGDVVAVCAAGALEIPKAGRAKYLCEVNAQKGATNWASILVEEVCEAVEQAALKDVKALREELVQSAAVCVAWIEAIDRRTK